eukprot:scaffold84733_cov54-Phaeocystis_antarctica.AAC.1
MSRTSWLSLRPARTPEADLSATDDASGCPAPRPASANPLLGAALAPRPYRACFRHRPSRLTVSTPRAPSIPAIKYPTPSRSSTRSSPRRRWPPRPQRPRPSSPPPSFSSRWLPRTPSSSAAAWPISRSLASQRGQSAALVAPQLAALAAWGARLQVWAALGCSTHSRGASTPLWYSGSTWGCCQPVPRLLIPRPLTIQESFLRPLPSTRRSRSPCRCWGATRTPTRPCRARAARCRPRRATSTPTRSRAL